MRPDVEVSQSGSVGQREAERGFESALSPSGFEDVGDGAGAEGVAFEGECDGPPALRKGSFKEAPDRLLAILNDARAQ